MAALHPPAPSLDPQEAAPYPVRPSEGVGRQGQRRVACHTHLPQRSPSPVPCPCRAGVGVGGCRQRGRMAGETEAEVEAAPIPAAGRWAQGAGQGRRQPQGQRGSLLRPAAHPTSPRTVAGRRGRVADDPGEECTPSGPTFQPSTILLRIEQLSLRSCSARIASSGSSYLRWKHAPHPREQDLPRRDHLCLPRGR